jgi:deoxyxylulose-5-phosphate synthase
MQAKLNKFLTSRYQSLVIVLLLFCSTLVFSQTNDICIELKNTNQILLFDNEVSLSDISTSINKCLDKLPEEEQRFQSITISMGVSITDDFLDQVKEEIKKNTSSIFECIEKHYLQLQPKQSYYRCHG